MQEIAIVVEGTVLTCVRLLALHACVRSNITERLSSPAQLLMFDFPALPPNMQQTATAQQELKLARKMSLQCWLHPVPASVSPDLMAATACHYAGDVLEFAVLSSLKHKDDAGFERNFNQLRTFYTDTRRASAAVWLANKPAIAHSMMLKCLLVLHPFSLYHSRLAAGHCCRRLRRSCWCLASTCCGCSYKTGLQNFIPSWSSCRSRFAYPP